MDLAEICRKAADTGKQAAAFIAAEAARFKRSEVEYKGLNDMVSYVDREAEKLLVAGLRQILPEAGFITEEGTTGAYNSEASVEGLFWIIDPLDGTTNFIHGIPFFSVSIALSRNGVPVIGIVIEVQRMEVFTAWQNGGAYLNGKRIQVSPVQKLSEGLMATGFPYNNFSRLPAYINILSTLLQTSHGLRRMGSAALDLAYVACGRMEGFFEFNLNPWDVAGGVVLVQEAGGTATDFKGRPNAVFGREIVAAGPVMAQLIDVGRGNWYPEIEEQTL